MKTITINITNEKLADKVIGLLESLESDGLEIVNKEDMYDLKALSITRVEEAIPFNDYLKNEH